MSLLLARLLADAGAISAFGALLFRAAIAEFPGRRRLVALSVATGLAGLAWWLLLARATYDAAAADILRYAWFGRVWLARAALLALSLLPGRAGLAAAAMSLAATAGIEHGWAMGGDPILVACQVAHLLAAGAWLGGLLPLALSLRAGATAPARRFARIGLPAVAVLGVTALVQGWVLGGGAAGLASAYGAVLAGKLALFAGLLALAARHRLRLVPGLPEARPALLRSLVVEIGLGVVVLAVAALLAGMAAPGG